MIRLTIQMGGGPLRNVSKSNSIQKNKEEGCGDDDDDDVKTRFRGWIKNGNVG